LKRAGSSKLRLGLLLCFLIIRGFAADSPGQIHINFAQRQGPLNISQMALGQGGLSHEPMWDDRITEIRALHPRIIRLFIQEYFNLLPTKGHYNFETLDQSVDTILKTGAKPLMCICFKPKLLFPKVDHDIVEPESYREWERLISAMVRHYKKRGAGIQYWEIANEPDIGESGGCPYRFTPENYPRYYQHTVAAILRADPSARVGGPALANSRSPILPALLKFCHTNNTPLHFISWHIYFSSPNSIRGTINYAKDLLKKYPDLKPETFLDEWNMDLGNPPLDPRYQPCYITETVWQMKDAGLDYSCYYHIRDWYVAFEEFAPFMSTQGTAFMTRWWNRMPQFDGLFDYQNQVRPAYFAFKLLSRLQGERIAVESSAPQIHGFATHDDQLRMENLLLWNFSDQPAAAEVSFDQMPRDYRIRHITLDATAPSSDENSRLHPDPPASVKKSDPVLRLKFDPYSIHYWSFE
jgi:xylan 1,4-beta-xylosidase